MDEHKFELIEHTADFGAVSYGATREEAFSNMACAMVSAIADTALIKPDTRLVFTIDSDEIADDVELLQAFLSRLIVVIYADGVLPINIESERLADGRLKCGIAGKKIDSSVEWTGPEIKAVPFHGMRVDKNEKGWECTAYFDI